MVATVGHFRDLPEHELGVDLDTMTPNYQTDPGKRGVVTRLKEESGKADEILLATDPDREGEAISWHVAQVLNLGQNAKRVRFHEITEAALRKAVAAAGPIDQNLVDAQQARRLLDRVVGYKVSPLVQTLGQGLSAGRVQTATLHLVCQRERDRLGFKAVPFWLVKVLYENSLTAGHCDEKGQELRLPTEAQAAEVRSLAQQGIHQVKSIDRKEVERRPPAPFTTSTLQQAASVKLGFKPDQTMKVAQSLFEVGHISYHRSDSVTLSEDAQGMARSWIREHQPESLPAQPPVYRSKDGAQEAHEAIRPTTVELPSELAGDEKALWELIRTRFLASQMKPAKVAQTLVILECTPREGGQPILFSAKGSQVLEAHWLKILGDEEEPEDPKASKDEDNQDQEIPAMQPGQNLKAERVGVLARETKPPARFTEAGLIKEMERLGIGRPSTYAATIATLFKRTYIDSVKKNVFPTPLGMKVDELMVEGLPELTSHEYTALMEEQLDRIAEGKLRWKEYLLQWWHKQFKWKLGNAAKIFGEKVAGLKKAAAEGNREAQKATGIDPDAPKCPDCGSPTIKRKGSKGVFYGCSRYPDCKGIAKDPKTDPKIHTELVCPDCGKPMAERKGPKGKFLGCTGYPKCKKILPIELTKKKAKKCPECGNVLTKKQGPKGPFWGCAGYPACRYTENSGK